MGDTVEQQTEQTIDNISAILETDGASLLDVVKVTVHLSDTSHFARYNSAQRFSQHYPVRTTVGSDPCGPRPRDADRNRLYRLQHRRNEREATAHFKEASSASKEVEFNTLL
jgi:hypothetical protein